MGMPGTVHLGVEDAGDVLALSGPRGALRIYAKDGNSRIRIISGGDPEPSGSDLVKIEWFATQEAAAGVAAYCALLLRAAHMGADDEGWHALPVPNLPNLLSVARNQLTGSVVLGAPLSGPAYRGPRRWTNRRSARLGFLAGQGLTAKRIADDPLILSTPNNVHRQAGNFGISLSEVPHGQIALNLPIATTMAIERIAAGQGLTREAFMRRWIIAALANPSEFRLTHFGSFGR